MKSGLLMLLIALSGIGLWDAAYLTYFESIGLMPPCPALTGFDCGAVLESTWSYIGPVPLSLLGALFYLTVLAISCGLLVFPNFTYWLKRLLVLITTSGFFTSLGLIYLQAFVIESWCLYCLISALTSTALFVCSCIFTYLDYDTNHSSHNPNNV